jgi:hypothetical protein
MGGFKIYNAIFTNFALDNKHTKCKEEVGSIYAMPEGLQFNCNNRKAAFIIR